MSAVVRALCTAAVAALALAGIALSASDAKPAAGESRAAAPQSVVVATTLAENGWW
ncbi:hypothetical protein ACFXDJ_10835 [Streptomyces sp. NPDC059443]|uniref:hypothetical protein n=1 Tax=unclassified Streptomyces TaxID=2593676 RepID=UPI0036989EA3